MIFLSHKFRNWFYKFYKYSIYRKLEGLLLNGNTSSSIKGFLFCDAQQPETMSIKII